MREQGVVLKGMLMRKVYQRTGGTSEGLAIELRGKAIEGKPSRASQDK